MKIYHVIFHLDEDSEQKANETFNNILCKFHQTFGN